MYTFEKLDIQGYCEESLQNTLFRLKEKTGKLALIFPGRGYTSRMPLLYYTTYLLLGKQFNVLTIDYDYFGKPEFETLEWDEKERWLFADVESAFNVVESLTDMRVKLLVGKSLGTLAVGHLLDSFPETRDCKVIWHTPLIGLPDLFEQIEKHHPESLFVIGSADPYYDKDNLSKLVIATRGHAVVVEGADHSMEVEDVKSSLNVMKQIVESIEAFI